MPNLKNKTILVTGGAGFIGSHLVDSLITQKPKKVTVVDNFFLGQESNLENARKSGILEIVNQDASDYGAMKKTIGNETDVVFNLAVIPLPVSLEKPAWSFDVNVNITKVLCELAREKIFSTLIHFSSSEVYGTALEGIMKEDHQLLPHTPYAASKAACDHLVYSYYKTFEIDTSIVRPFNNYGPRQNDKSYAGIIPITIRRILSGKTPVIYGDGEQTRDFIFVEDTAKAAVEVYKNASTRGRIINLASGKEISINEVVRQICDQLSWTRPIKYDKPRPGDVRRHRGDISLAKKLINFKQTVNFSDGIKKTVNWYAQK